MAWVSVHESVLCAKLREMADILERPIGEALGILVILWLWGLKNADQYGYIRIDDEAYLGKHLYYENGDDTLKPEEIVKALVKSGWIEKEEGQLLRLHDWEEWQKEWYRYQSRLKIGNESKKRARSKMKEQTEDIIKPDPAPTIKEKKAEPAKKEYTTNFLDVWNIYPRKSDKAQAFQKYNARLKEGYSERDLYLSVQNYIDDINKQHIETKYILWAKTFFGSEGRFLEYLPKKDEPTDEDENLFRQFLDPED